jgi:dihydroflavonol-4-reductase
MAAQTFGDGGLRVLITGATGFLGRALLRSLSNLDKVTSVAVFALPGDAVPDEWLRSGVVVHRGDIASRDDVRRAVQGQQVVLHAAGLVSYAQRDRGALMRVNRDGAANVAEACVEFGVRRLVHVSSVGAIGAAFDGTLGDEDASFNWPADFGYMSSKSSGQAEVLRRVTEQGLSAVVINPASIMGPGDDDPASAQNRLYGMVCSSPVLPSFSGGLGVVDVRDVADMTVAAIANGVSGRCYLAVGANLSYRSVLLAIADALGLRRSVVGLPRWLLSVAGRAAEAASGLSGKPAPLTRSYAELSPWHCYYDNSRSCEDLRHSYRCFRQTVSEGSRYYSDRFR